MLRNSDIILLAKSEWVNKKKKNSEKQEKFDLLVKHLVFRQDKWDIGLRGMWER